MSRFGKLVATVLQGTADRNIRFDELCWLLQRLGFEEHVRGSHHIFRKSEVPERINLQRDGAHAKAYQVKQVRDVIVAYGLTEKN